ncbi:major capsid protein, partial [Mycobacterium terramassiliense]
LANFTDFENDAAYNALVAEFKAWEAECARHNLGKAFATRMGTNPAGIGTAPNTDSLYQLGAKGLGREVYPFGLPKDEVRKAYEVTAKGGNYIIKGHDFAETKTFTTVDSLLVPQQAPGVVPEYFEARLIDHLPVVPIGAPSYQFLQHQFADDTGGPDFVAEGTAKPQWNPTAEKVVVTAQKIAAYFDESSESRMDAPQWNSYLINTLFRLIQQKENHAILYGTVSSSLGIQGWSTLAGILTHDASGDPAGSTNLDSLELAINQLRIQSGVFANANLIIMSPTTWSATRRLKATTGQYIAGDPLHEAVTSAWGVPVVTTTAANDGDAFVVDTHKMGAILVRQGIETHMGYHGDGLIENILTTVAEERLTLATVIPSSVNYVTNLATS